LLTAKGERIENPNFGTALKAQLFEQIDPTSFSDIQESIIESVQTYIPEIKINKIDFIPDTDINVLTVSITYQILISGQTDTVTVNFE
jgi:phage baseplate assembly protein W